LKKDIEMGEHQHGKGSSVAHEQLQDKNVRVEQQTRWQAALKKLWRSCEEGAIQSVTSEMIYET